MFREIQNLKDSSQASHLTLKDNSQIPLSYTKTNKLIAGLYMVTDILDKDEPIRARLRILGSEVISDIFSFPSSAQKLNNKIAEILSFLDIASAVSIISHMNSSILKREFLLLQKSIEESTPNSFAFNGKSTLEEFIKDENSFLSIHKPADSIGHNKMNRIGVQKGHTLMKALSKLEMSDTISKVSNGNHSHVTGEKFDQLKKERRDHMVKIIRSNSNGTSIKDIVSAFHNLGKDTGEKTIQRELIGMVKDGVLNKTGEKRWSRYFVS